MSVYTLRSRLVASQEVLPTYQNQASSASFQGSVEESAEEDLEESLGSEKAASSSEEAKESDASSSNGSICLEEQSDEESLASSAAALFRKRSKRFKVYKEPKDLLQLLDSAQIFGREAEIETILRVLADEEKKRFVLLLGPSGIGKTSLVKKLKLLIEEKNVPDHLKDSQIFVLDSNQLLAACGSLESVSVIKQFKRFVANKITDPTHTILYIQNFEKLLQIAPFEDFFISYAKGNIACIASMQEPPESLESPPKRFFEQFFERLDLKECSKEQSRQILRQKFLARDVKIDHSVFSLLVDFSQQYFKEGVLPQKAIYLMDQSYQQARLEQLASPREDFSVLADHVKRVVTEKTGLAKESLCVSSGEFVEKVRQNLLRKVIGQDLAVNRLVNAYRAYKRGLHDPERPWGVFLLLGSTGVGKTHLCKQLASELFPLDRGAERKGFIRFDMSEYMENHNISRLIGAPPGYEGNQMGGQLTETLKRQPHCIVLLDEIEKAHPEVLQVFLQVFDAGHLTDGQGNTVDCKKALFLMTSNLGSAAILEQAKKKNLRHEDVLNITQPFVIKHLRPELVNRLEILPFRPLQKTDLAALLELEREKMELRLSKQKVCKLRFTKRLKRYFFEGAKDLSFGGRAFSRSVEEALKEVLSNVEEDLLQAACIEIDCLDSKLFVQAF